MAYTDIPKGQNADYYISGRARALYRLEYPAATDPPVGTPAWWSNEGIKDAWQMLPSRIGSEAVLSGADGQPLPVRLGVPDPKTGVVPKGPYAGGMGPNTPASPSPGPVSIRLPRWATDYWSAYLVARQDTATALKRRSEGNVWTAYYQRGLADGLSGAPPLDPSGFVPSPSQLAEVAGLVPGAGPPVVRPAPPYVPRNNGGGGVYIPPPPLPLAALITREIFGLLRGRRVPFYDILVRDGMRNHLIRGGRVIVAAKATEGFGLAGTPGAWSSAAGGASPAAYGLEPDIGVVAFDGQIARPLDAYTLKQLLGTGWAAIVRAAT